MFQSEVHHHMVTSNIISSPICTDGQVSIRLYVRKGTLSDAFAEDIEYYSDSSCLLGGIKLSQYRLFLDIRELLGRSPDSELDLGKLTPEENETIAMMVLCFFNKLRGHQLDVNIDYNDSCKKASIFIGGEGIKGLTLKEVWEILRS